MTYTVTLHSLYKYAVIEEVIEVETDISEDDEEYDELIRELASSDGNIISSKIVSLSNLKAEDLVSITKKD